MTASFHTTRTGVRIGLTYIRPPHRVQGDALKVQAALLEKRTLVSQSFIRILIGRILQWL